MTEDIILTGEEAPFFAPAPTDLIDNLLAQYEAMRMKVERVAEKFSIGQKMLPRNLFPNARLPLVFATFTKDRERSLHGFLLYREAQEIRAIDRRWQEAVADARDTRGTWFGVVHEIMVSLGGEADLEHVYSAIQPKRPSDNPHWKAKVRQVLQHTGRFTRTGPSRYATQERLAA